MTNAAKAIEVASGQLQAVPTSKDQIARLPLNRPRPRRDRQGRALARCFSTCSEGLSKTSFWHQESCEESRLMSSTCCHRAYLRSAAVSSAQHALLSALCDCPLPSAAEQPSAGQSGISEAGLCLHELYSSCLSKLIKLLNCLDCCTGFIFL